MMTRSEIKEGYQRAKEEIVRQERVVLLYRRLFELRKKMEYLSEKYPDLVWTDCSERKGKSVPLAFCIEKCTLKCRDFMAVKKYHPKLISVIDRINGRFCKTLKLLEEIKRD
jgi:hypothetical protein